ncbi:MAG: hydrogenase 3 maturation endopeptidase HyCI [Candidatus Omnitrophica bacterium]|nr:hydrogenase 3 maturation endopeptidase HyCI [Candidatus Omnitrophota bacterium]MDD5436466.1 hydrogenase 3 maturation endopeptidase HyCI [Candidatus Omnitrophota bacterium]
MPKLEKFLKDRLKTARRVALLAIGSDLRADDAAGLLVAEGVKRLLKKTGRRFKIFIGATAPENLTGDIKRFKPSHILLVDSVDFHDKPGSIVVLSPRDIGDGVSFSTHKMPSKVLMQYFLNSFECDPILIGIQPASIDLGKPPSRHVIDSSREVASAIARSVDRLPAKKAMRIDKNL